MRYPPIWYFSILNYQFVHGSSLGCGIYHIIMSEMILLRVKNRIEILLFFQNALYPLALFFSKTHNIHLVVRAQCYIKCSSLQNINH